MTTTLVAVEAATPDPRPSLFRDGPDFTVHLAPQLPGGRVAALALCGFDRLATDGRGQPVHTTSAGGGFQGTQYDHQPCTTCATAGTGAVVTGTHAGLFPDAMGPALATAADVAAGLARYADTPGGHDDRRTLEEDHPGA